MKEEWRDIKGYPNYMVSNLGRVKSLNYHRTGREGILSNKKTIKGYLRITLSKNSIRKNYLIHRLVAEAFIPNPDNLPFINHKDENPSNNCASNLEYCDVLYNNNYGTRNKRISEKHKGVLFSEEHKNNLSKALTNRSEKSKPVLEIDKNTNEVIAEFPSVREVKRQFGYDQGFISACCRGENKSAYGFKWKYKNG